MAGRQTPLLGCDGHLPTGQLLPAVCRCCCRVGRHPQGREIQRTGRPVHLPAHCCGVTWSHELGSPQVPGRPRSEDFACVWRRQGNYVFVSTHLFCYFVLTLFCCTLVLSWTTAGRAQDRESSPTFYHCVTQPTNLYVTLAKLEN